MAKSEQAQDVEPGEQMALIDVVPAKAKPIVKKARKYRQIILERLDLQKKEADQLQALSDMIEAADIVPLNKEGVIHFKYEDVDIVVVPGKTKIKVKIEE